MLSVEYRRRELRPRGGQSGSCGEGEDVGGEIPPNRERGPSGAGGLGEPAAGAGYFSRRVQDQDAGRSGRLAHLWQCRRRGDQRGGKRKSAEALLTWLSGGR